MSNFNDPKQDPKHALRQPTFTDQTSTKDFGVTLPKSSQGSQVALEPILPSAHPRPSRSSTDLVEQVYKQFSESIENLSSVTHEEIAKCVEPVISKMKKYLKTVDLDKINRDLSPYAKSTMVVVSSYADRAKKEVSEVLERINSPETSESVIGKTRNFLNTAVTQVSNFAEDYLTKLGSAIKPAVDYVGTKLFGEDSYRIALEKFNYYALLLSAKLMSLIHQLFKAVTEEKKLDDLKKETSLPSESNKQVFGEGKKALESLDQISRISEQRFGDETKDFLSHRITDGERRGIDKQQPEMVRDELMEDLSRKIFDPFPSFENREKDRKEQRQKHQYERVNSNGFARVGIDGEMSAADKLEVALKAKIQD